tara:strand:- start:2535 stop:3617 length:1083 start_codon:yes stop_codon:yes gene_type:complete
MDSKITDAYLNSYNNKYNFKKVRMSGLYEQVIQKQFNEDVGLYTKGEEGYKHIGDVSDDIYRKVQRIASGKNTSGIITTYLNNKFYTDESFKGEDDFLNLVALLDDGEFENYIEADGKPLLADNRVNNVISLASEFGMSKDLATKVARFTPVDKGGSNVGPGEILLAIIFGDVTNAVGGGDLSINGEALEVKGQGGRLGQQPGRGGIKFNTEALTSNLSNPPVIDSVSLEGIIYQLYKSYQAENKESLFVEDLKKGLKDAYPYSSLEFLNGVDYENGLSKRQGRSIARGSIRKALAKINIDNYARKYNYKDFVFIDKSNLNYAMFTTEDALSKGGLIDSEKLISQNYSTNDFYPNFKFIF